MKKLFITFIFVATLTLRNQGNFGRIIVGLLFAGVVNFFYNLIVIFRINKLINLIQN